MSPASCGARRPAPVAQVQTLLDRLLAAASRHGADTRLVLPASAVGVLLLGAGRDAPGELLAGASAQERPTQVLRLDEQESTQKETKRQTGRGRGAGRAAAPGLGRAGAGYGTGTRWSTPRAGLRTAPLGTEQPPPAPPPA